jgi:hypothetical protein
LASWYSIRPKVDMNSLRGKFMSAPSNVSWNFVGLVGRAA